MTDLGINNLIIKARAKGEWLVIESLQSIIENHNRISNLIKIIQDSTAVTPCHDNYRLWITFPLPQQAAATIKETNPTNY